MAYDDLESRKKLTFAQAEGLISYPTQLNRKDMPKTLRARLWDVIFTSFNKAMSTQNYTKYVGSPWTKVLRDEFVIRSGGMPNNFSSRHDRTIERFSTFFASGSYADIYDLLQFFIRHAGCPSGIASEIDKVLKSERAAFRVVDGDTFVPVGTEQELQTVASAMSLTRQSGQHGAFTHLRQAAESLSQGRFSDSVRDSIHAVEAVARTLEPSAELSKALNKIEAAGKVHGAMKKGFLALYGYASDEEGIRHPLLEDGDAKVDEADAIFMIGACASFVTYLINKSNQSGISAK